MGECPGLYSYLLYPGLVGLAAIAVLGIVHAASIRDGRPQLVPMPPAAETVAACGFLLIPFVSVTVAKVATGAFTDRYAMPAVLGFAVLVGSGTAVAFSRTR